MRGRGPAALFALVAVVTLAVRQAEHTFLQNRVFAVPKGEREAESLRIVADSGQAVLAPTISPAAGVIVRKIFPSVAVGRVILSHRAPLALREVWPPLLPIVLTELAFVEALLFRV